LVGHEQRVCSNKVKCFEKELKITELQNTTNFGVGEREMRLRAGPMESPMSGFVKQMELERVTEGI